MPNRELKDAHRRSADRIRELLEELESAEKEFNRLTEKIRALEPPPRNASPTIAPRT